MSSASKARRIIPIAAAQATREALAPVGASLYQSEKKIYPRAVSGWFAGWRWALVWATQLLFYGLPWLQWNARPALLFDLAARRFYIFDLVLYPQDFIYLAGLLIVSAFALFLFTTVAGRLWCGYACPQTVYTELFMWVERRIEGDRIARMRLDANGASLEKWLRKGGKHAAWAAIGLWTGVTFVGYFTPIRSLSAELMTLSLGPWESFWVLFYGFATYGNAGFMREQVCKYMCPYARFQGVMFDRDTLVIGYDTTRGDPRGSRPKSLPHAALAGAGKGDCIDCGLCVQVCPTGIDIRKGLQIECIGCAACIDVCDSVMDKMSYPRGLIRYATQNGIDGRWTRGQMWRRVLRPRVLVYTALLLGIVAAFGTSLALRKPFKVDVVRDRGALARQVEDGRIENVYRLQVMNASESAQHFRVQVEGLAGAVIASKSEFEVGSTQARWVAVDVQIAAEAARALGPGMHKLRFEIERLASRDGGQVEVVEKSTFMVPR
jgi:cytochrome c oxidase accessory protein FixG